MTARDIEIAVARLFGFRQNIIVPNVHWGWNMRHEADMVIVRPSLWAIEVEIKTSRSNVLADASKAVGHWETGKISRVYFAIPEELNCCESIPLSYGVITCDGTYARVVRAARKNPKACRITSEEALKLAHLGAMRIWDLKIKLTAAQPDRRKS